MVIAGDDNCVHVIDPRIPQDEGAGELFKGKEANSSARGFKALFCGNNIVSVGFARYLAFPESHLSPVWFSIYFIFRGSSRQICLYSQDQEIPVQKIILDTSPSPLNPFYDEDTKSPSAPSSVLKSNLFIGSSSSGPKDPVKYTHTISQILNPSTRSPRSTAQTFNWPSHFFPKQ